MPYAAEQKIKVIFTFVDHLFLLPKPSPNIIKYRVSISFWLSHTLFIYLFYLCSILCPSKDLSIINKQGYGLDRKGTLKNGKIAV